MVVEQERSEVPHGKPIRPTQQRMKRECRPGKVRNWKRGGRLEDPDTQIFSSTGTDLGSSLSHFRDGDGTKKKTTLRDTSTVTTSCGKTETITPQDDEKMEHRPSTFCSGHRERADTVVARQR